MRHQPAQRQPRHGDPLRQARRALRSRRHHRCDQPVAQRLMKHDLGHRLIHGDARTGNLLFDDTRWLLGDWDSIANGPRLQDFIPVMTGHRRFGRPYTLWTSFCHAYGIGPALEQHPAASIPDKRSQNPIPGHLHSLRRST
ncbi:phosphotransferase [Nonomuraea phyllanthi]|nr:phosphotransferase [Nonomuraea phyllanthi]